MVGGLQPIESNLHKHLTEHLNAEVVLGTITGLDVALQWLTTTFLYIRAKKNPKYYKINCGLNSEEIDTKLLGVIQILFELLSKSDFFLEICQIEINKLTKAGMVILDEDMILQPTANGVLMAKYYLAFETMKLFTSVFLDNFFFTN